VSTEAASRARELATWQCEVEEIAAVLGEEFGWDEQQTASWMTRMAGMLTRSRLTARAELRGRIWRASHADGDDRMHKDVWAICSELMRQHAGWSKSSTPMDELMRAFIAAQKAADKRGPKTGPTGVAA
jgi:hypothetical protein